MARGVGAVRRRSSSKSRLTPYPLPFCHERHMHREMSALKTSSKALEKNDWQDATCSVCMEYPHNAVLLLCSSHDKGCRPYMCGTSYRFSNCLDQFKKAYTKEEMSEIACPLCRGQVKGWTVVDPAREYLNMKKRSCMQDECAFNGTYRELRKHMRVTHPCVRPRQVDPALEQKWRRLELERERRDVITTIRATTPGALVLGDYVIEGNGGYGGHDSDENEGGVNDRLSNRNVLEVLLLWQAFRSEGNGGGGSIIDTQLLANRAASLWEDDDDDIDDDDDDDDDLQVMEGRVGAGRSEQQRRRRRRSRRRSIIDLT